MNPFKDIFQKTDDDSIAHRLLENTLKFSTCTNVHNKVKYK